MYLFFWLEYPIDEWLLNVKRFCATIDCNGTHCSDGFSFFHLFCSFYESIPTAYYLIPLCAARNKKYVYFLQIPFTVVQLQMDSTSVGGKGISIACQIFVKRILVQMDNQKNTIPFCLVARIRFTDRSVRTILIACKRCRWAPSCTSLLHMDMAKIESIKRRKQNWLHDRQWNINVFFAFVSVSILAGSSLEKCVNQHCYDSVPTQRTSINVLFAASIFDGFHFPFSKWNSQTLPIRSLPFRW